MPNIFISMYMCESWSNVLFYLVEQHEYYSLDATYRNWLKVEMQNAAVPPDMLSAEENDQAVAAAKETLELAFLLLKSKFINGCIIWRISVKIYFLCCKISDSICKYSTSFSLFLILSVAIRGWKTMVGCCREQSIWTLTAYFPWVACMCNALPTFWRMHVTRCNIMHSFD